MNEVNPLRGNTTPSAPSTTPTMFGPRFESAMAWACSLHYGQRRKSTKAPYIIHPLAVASIVGQFGGDEDQAIAGLLHDTMEDCGVDNGTISARYGARVAQIVSDCTDTTETPKPAWKPRKEAHLAKTRLVGADTKLVMAADKMHNALSISRDLRRASVGQLVWTRFSAPKDEVLWYYHSMLDALAHEWQHELLVELRCVVATLS